MSCHPHRCPLLFRSALCLAAGTLVFGAAEVSAQNFRQLGNDFLAMRKVSVPGDSKATVCIVEFPHHGEIEAPGKNIAVISTKTRKAVAVRVLQVGPGDFCRIAFEIEPGTTAYDLFYGGDPPDRAEIPEWSARGGLLLETREFRDFNLNSLDELRRAYEKAPRIGSDYVDAVHHGANPFTLKAAPFLSRYSGTIILPSSGEYAFYTSSQDCSFLSIDGRVVASAPGRHRPERRARKRTTVRLTAGPHSFEYYHAATSAAAVMAAAWEVHPDSEKPKPEAIPAEAFRAAAIVRGTIGPLARPGETATADFLYHVAGDVPLPDNPHHLIGVQFHTTTPGDLSARGATRWDFGDGQTSDLPHPVHVYLEPGIYSVTLTLARGARRLTTTNRIQVETPQVTDKKQVHDLDMYLPILDSYDPAKLDGRALVQLVAAYFWKADKLVADADQLDREAEEAALRPTEEEPVAPPRGRAARRPDASPEDDEGPPQNADDLRAEAQTYFARGVAAGKVALLAPTAAEQGPKLYELATLIGPVARDTLGDSKLAGQIWHGAAQRLGEGEHAAECEAVAADIALNDLLNVPAGRVLLETAERQLGAKTVGEVASIVQRVRGDLYAESGEGEKARRAYRDAEKMHQIHSTYFERTAWLGAFSRSAEQYLKTRRFDRAATELRGWQDAYPSTKIEGYFHVLMARYWQGRKLYPQAVALADQLLVVNADSPYMDQLLMISAECDRARGETARATATLHALVDDYPGSPLVGEAKQKIAEWE